MLLATAAIVAGLILLVWSADKFVEGAAVTARHLGVSTLLIGMLVIGFGTSAPELMVSALAAGQGNPGLALGNGYGSNIANIGLILGAVALISPLAVHSQVIRQELPLLCLVTLISAWLLLDGAVSRLDAVLLLVLLAAVIGLSIWRANRGGDDALAMMDDKPPSADTMSLKAGVIWTLVGLVLLIASSRLLVWGAVYVAKPSGSAI